MDKAIVNISLLTGTGPVPASCEQEPNIANNNIPNPEITNHDQGQKLDPKITNIGK